MPAQLGKSLVARRSNWDYTGKEEQKGDLTLLYILDFLGGSVLRKLTYIAGAPCGPLAG